RGTRVVTVIDQTDSTRELQQLAAHGRSSQLAEHRLRIRYSDSPDACGRQSTERVGNGVAPRQRQLQPRACSADPSDEGRGQSAAVLDSFGAKVRLALHTVGQYAPRRVRPKRAYQRVVSIEHRDRLRPVQSFDEFALGPRNLQNRAKKLEMGRRDASDYRYVR